MVWGFKSQIISGYEFVELSAFWVTDEIAANREKQEKEEHVELTGRKEAQIIYWWASLFYYNKEGINRGRAGDKWQQARTWLWKAVNIIRLRILDFL